MQLDLNNLPSDTVLLHRLVRDMASVVAQRNGEIERLQLIIRQLQRAQYGRRSERLDPDQLALGLEDVEGDVAHAEAQREADTKPKDRKPRRKPLPEHLPREEIVLDVDSESCPCCGGPLLSLSVRARPQSRAPCGASRALQRCAAC
jgi:transposase